MSPRRRTLLACAVLAILTLAAFSPIWGNGFVSYDDPDYVTENPHVLGGLSLRSVAWAFQSGYAGNWHPVTWLSHMLDVQVFGLRAWGHHVSSLLLHSVNAILLFLVLKRGMRSAECGAGNKAACFWRCFLVAALFAVHPLRVESVAWVAERKDVLSGFFLLLTLWAYVRFAQCGMRSAECGVEGDAASLAPRSTLPRSVFYLLALVFFALGLMSKPMLVTTPFLLLLLDWWPLNRMRIAECGVRNAEATTHVSRFTFHALRFTLVPLFLEKLPFLLLSAASCVVTFQVQHRAGAVSSLETVPVEFRLTNALISYVRYLGKALWPTKLAVFYPAPAEWPLSWVAGAAVLLAVATVAAIVARSRWPYWPFGWLWYLGTLVPVIGIVQVGQQSMADRYTYIPLIGLAVLVVWAGADIATRWPQTRIWLSAIAAAAVAACGIATWQQSAYWCSSHSLFARALAVTPGNFVAYNNLGVECMDAGDLPAAEQYFTEAVRIKRYYAEALGNLALCRSKEGKPAEAAELFAQSLQVRPIATVEYDFARLLFDEGNLAEAAAHYRAALRLKPELVEAWYNLGLAETRLGNRAEAERCHRAALKLNPNHASAHLALGALLADVRFGDEAMSHFEAAVRSDPQNADAQFNLAFALNGRGDYAGAAVHYGEACRLRPKDAEARSSYALALLAAGRLPEAIEQLQASLRLRPEARLHYYLALALDSSGRPEEALPHYRAAVRLSPETPLYVNDLAWFLATIPNAELRNGAEGVKLAERARDLSGGQQARYWGTLDAAYAEVGRFPDALAAAARALELAKAAGQADIVAEAQARIALYREGKPYRRELPADSHRPKP